MSDDSGSVVGLKPGEPLTASKVRELWDRGVKATRSEREQAAVNAQFLRNRQWVYFNRGSGRLEEVPRSPARVRATVPRIGPDSRRIVAKLMRRPLVFDVQPTAPDDAAIRASRISEAALVETQRKQSWEDLRLDHTYSVWEAGTAGIAVDWDDSVGAPLGMGQNGRVIGTGDVRLRAVSIHEIACEPGTRDLEKALWWIHGVALPPPEVQRLYALPAPPRADARAVDMVWRFSDGDRLDNVPLSMVLTYYQRPFGSEPGRVATVVNDEFVDGGDWPFPFTDRLNIAIGRVEPIHGRWYGHTPVSDAVGVQAIYNASWSSIIEHMKLCGNARLWCPTGSVDDIEELTDTPGEAVEYNAINGQSPEYKSPPTMPDWWVRQPAMLEAAMDDILGVHDISRGEAPSGVESGVALSILSENDDTPVGALAKTLGECWGRVATMVLKVYEANVQESRQAMIYMPGNIPETVTWSGGDLIGQTTATVPLDAVMPRSRAAQAAYALQLYDRGIIQSGVDLAKIADLPDQDSLIEGIDPDTARAERENYWMALGQPRTVAVYDDHGNHLQILRDFMCSERFEYLPEEVQAIFYDHGQAHEMYAAQGAAMQTQAAGVSPIAAMLPTVDTKTIPTEELEQAQAMSQSVPGGPMAGPMGGGPMADLPPEVQAQLQAELQAELQAQQQQPQPQPQQRPPTGGP